MNSIRAKALLLDIEGTVCPVRFVHDVLFPFARSRMEAFLDAHWTRPDVAAARGFFEQDAGRVFFSPGQLLPVIYEFMDRDAKARGLKALQGIIWHDGYASGHLKAPLYGDVPTSLTAWHKAGLRIDIFSSGSVAAQIDLFSHTSFGDLTPYLTAYHDTATGSKREAISYAKIAAAMRLTSGDILFISDIAAELDAARAAGMNVLLCLRENAAPPVPATSHTMIRSFEDFEVIAG